MLYINVNSVRFKFNELCVILLEKLADILIVGETKIDESFPNAQFNVPEYSLYRQDRNEYGGGVMMYVHSSIPHRIRHDLNKFVCNGLEGIILEMNVSKKKWLLSGLYKPPSVKDHIFEDTFCKVIDTLFHETKNVICTGDLNFNMKKKNTLKDICNIYGLKNKIIGATCFKGDSETALDVFLVSNTTKEEFGSCVNTDIGVSDCHNIVGCCFNSVFKKPGKKIVQFRDYKRFDLKKFQENLEKMSFNVCITHKKVDEQMNDFHERFLNVVNEHVPLKTKYVKKGQAPFMTSDLRHAIYKKCMLRNRYFKNKSKENWSLYKTQRNLVTKLRRLSIRTYFKLKCENSSKPYEFWKVVKPFISNKEKYSGSDIILLENDKIFTDPFEVCTIFNDFFAKAAKNIGFNESFSNKLHDQDLVREMIEKYKNHPSILKIKSLHGQLNENEFEFKHTTENEVFKILKKLDTKKASGYDKISPQMIKYSMDYLVPYLTHIINTSIDQYTFPLLLKYAEISAIYKKKDKLSKENYRPVSVLIVLSKIFEKIYTCQIENFFRNIFNPMLSAYRRNYGCHDVLLKLVEEWRMSLDENKYCGALLMDLSKAFDCLPHGLIICKFHAYGFSESACLLLASYLSNRNQRVKIGCCKSSWSLLFKGVPQGSVMGPLMFNVFIHDLFYHIENCYMFNYADDNTLFYSHKTLDDLISVIKRDTEIVVEWFKNNGMKANPDKFQFIVSSRKNPSVEINLDVCNTTLKAEENVVLLGLKIDKNLTFDDHIKDICLKAGKQLNVLRRFSKTLTVKHKMNIFNSFIVSHFKYCPLIWHFTKKRNIRMVEKIHERGLRFVFNDVKSSYQELLSICNRTSLYHDRLRLIAIQVYKILHSLSPMYLNELCIKKENNYLLRDDCILFQPKVNTVTYGIHSFRYHSSKIWNSLPAIIKSATTLSKFKKDLYKWQGDLCNCSFCVNC
jgi:hypothetical protein